MKDILTKKGIVKEDKVVNILAPKICPSCREPNKPDSQFCHKCTFVMSFEAYHKSIEERDKKDEEMQEIRQQLKSLQQDLQDFKEYELWTRRNQEYLRERKGQLIKKEMEKGKDLRTVLREMMDIDKMLSEIKNLKMPRISKELLKEELIEIKKSEKNKAKSRL